MASWLALLRFPTTARDALPLTAVAIGLVLLGFGLWMQQQSQGIVLSQAAKGQACHDTCYLVSHGYSLRQMGWACLAVALLLAATRRLGKGPILSPLPWLFWIYALGSLAMVLLTTFPPLPMPRRHVNYPEWGRVTNQVLILASVLTFLGAAGMVVTLAVAGTQSLLRHKR